MQVMHLIGGVFGWEVVVMSVVDGEAEEFGSAGDISKFTLVALAATMGLPKAAGTTSGLMKE
jgi:hypothetical protein